MFPEVRHEVWPFLLHYYPFHSRASDRESIREKKMKEYLDLSQKRYITSTQQNVSKVVQQFYILDSSTYVYLKQVEHAKDRI